MASAAGGPTVVCAADILSEPPWCLSDWDEIDFTESKGETEAERGMQWTATLHHRNTQPPERLLVAIETSLKKLKR